MADDDFCDFAFDAQAAARDQQSIEREAAATRACEVERVRAFGVPVQQSNDWALTVSRAQLQTLPLSQRDIDLFHVYAAVGDLDHAMWIIGRILIRPLSQCGVDARKLLAGADAIEFI